MKLGWKPITLSLVLAAAMSAGTEAGPTAAGTEAGPTAAGTEAGATAGPGASAQQAATNSGDLQKQFDALRAQVQAMQKDLDEIKALLAPLRRPSPPVNLTLDLGTRPMKGAPAAKVTLVELTDYQ